MAPIISLDEGGGIPSPPLPLGMGRGLIQNIMGRGEGKRVGKRHPPNITISKKYCHGQYFLEPRASQMWFW